MMKRLNSLVAGAAFLSLTPAFAALSPVAIGIVDKVEFPPEDFTIVGARVSLGYGIHRNIYGVDLGVIGNMTEQNFVGIGVAGGFNSTAGQATIIGLQAAGVANVNSGKSWIYGVQVAAGVNSNQGEGSGFGIEAAGIANLSGHTSFAGIQIAPYNHAHEIYGFQIGLVNVVDNLHGLQIGLLNFNHQGLFAVSPILNIGF